MENTKKDEVKLDPRSRYDFDNHQLVLFYTDEDGVVREERYGIAGRDDVHNADWSRMTQEHLELCQEGLIADEMVRRRNWELEEEYKARAEARLALDILVRRTKQSVKQPSLGIEDDLPVEESPAKTTRINYRRFGLEVADYEGIYGEIRPGEQDIDIKMRILFNSGYKNLITGKDEKTKKMTRVRVENASPETISKAFANTYKVWQRREAKKTVQA